MWFRVLGSEKLLNFVQFARRKCLVFGFFCSEKLLKLVWFARRKHLAFSVLRKLLNLSGFKEGRVCSRF